MDETIIELKKIIDDLTKKLEDAQKQIKYLEDELCVIKIMTNYNPH